MNYSEKELDRLHCELVDILKEISRICQILNIHCITLGGTAIGAYYFRGFVRWDDDIDLGMKRDDYELFLNQAPGLISDRFFVQCLKTEPKTPFYFIKVRKNNTLFVQQEYKDFPIHHGIFVDIFPLDNVPNNYFFARVHRRLVQFLEGSFLRRQCKQAILEGQLWMPIHVSKIVADIRFALLKIVPTHLLYWLMHKTCALFNKRSCQYVDVIKSSVDRIATESLIDMIPIQFEGVSLFAPKDMSAYLKHHYPDLKSPDELESLWKSHAPYLLSFDTSL